MKTTKKTTHVNPETTKYQRSYEATASERAELDPARFVPINIDIPLAITTVKGALPLLSTLRDDIEKTFRSFDVAELDRLQPYAEALAWAHTEVLAAARPSEDVPKLAARATEIRDQLLTDAGALVKRGLLDAQPIAELKGTTGYLNVVSDVVVLARMMRERWTSIAGQTAVKHDELVEADALYERFMDAYGERERQPVRLAAATDQRARAFTLLVNAYDEVRRAVTFVRWHDDDVERFAPSLYGNRVRGSHGQGDKTGDKPPVNQPTQPEPATPATPAAPSPFANGAPALGASTAVGMPGSSPFTH